MLGRSHLANQHLERRHLDLIELRDLTFYGYHGVLPEEQRLGQRFIVSVRLRLSLQAAGQSDSLDQTVNYAEVAEAVQAIVEGPPFKLIEALAERIAQETLGQFARVQSITVRIEKPSAPISAVPTSGVAIEIDRSRTASDAGGPPSDRGGALSATAIRALLQNDPPLVSPITDPDAQIQPNGIDATLESVWRIGGPGALGLTNADRVIPERTPVESSPDGWYQLPPGNYIIRLQETVALPLDIMAFGRPRSSLLRCAAALHTAVWDAGYQGRSESLLVVYGADGIRLARGARVLQLVFVRLDAATHAYAGAYQGENIPPS
jgi:dUTP pyrophosphatase